jgi:hypothetical protein
MRSDFGSGPIFCVHESQEASLQLVDGGRSDSFRSDDHTEP